MKVIVAGSRSIANRFLINRAINESTFKITELVSGGAVGVDVIAEYLYRDIVPIKRFIPEWQTYGRSAGVLRNAEMAEYADALIAIWDGESKGTANMIAEMEKLGKPVFVWNTKERP